MEIKWQIDERPTAFKVLFLQPTFNPFYSQLSIKLGKFDRKYRMAFQCCIWDRIRDITNLKKNEQTNLAKFTSHLIKDKLLSLTCLKVIEFSELNKHLVRFIKQILTDLLNEADPKLMTAPFLVVAAVPKLSLFRDGLRLFLRHFMLRKEDEATRCQIFTTFFFSFLLSVKLGTKANVFAPFRPGLKLLSKAGSKGNLLGSIPKKLYELFCIILRIEFHNHVSYYYFWIV
jgi:hypothetical protein